MKSTGEYRCADPDGGFMRLRSYCPAAAAEAYAEQMAADGQLDDGDTISVRVVDADDHAHFFQVDVSAFTSYDASAESCDQGNLVFEEDPT